MQIFFITQPIHSIYSYVSTLIILPHTKIYPKTLKPKSISPIYLKILIIQYLHIILFPFTNNSTFPTILQHSLFHMKTLYFPLKKSFTIIVNSITSNLSPGQLPYINPKNFSHSSSSYKPKLHNKTL